MYNTPSKEQQLIILGLIISIIIGLGVMAYRHFFSKSDQEITIVQPKENSPFRQAKEIVIHLAGAVKKEGVYRLKVGDRLIDVLELAGGVNSNADLSAVNLAEEVKDGQKIVIPARQAGLARQSGQARITGQAGLISINTANEKELDSLPGIGPVTAKAIVAYRAKIGSFSQIEQLLEVPKIGRGKLETIKNMLTL